MNVSILERNLAALARTSPRTVELVRAAAARGDVEFVGTDEEGVLSAQVGSGAAARALASRRRPLAEGRKFAEQVDIVNKPFVAVTGFGVGHHVRALAERMGRAGVILVLEPDVALLRAVLERVDHSAWLGASNVAVFTDPADRAEVTRALAGMESLASLGVQLMDHGPSAARIGAGAAEFQKNVADVVQALKPAMHTALLHMETTAQNMYMNLGDYVRRPGIAELAGSAQGRPAIVVSAGPSLRRNMDLLAEPGVRERFVIVAAQTVLKPLLARGIRPHFVVALDYSEISRRFYEGLTAEDLEGITLVVRPEANPAILEAFPGEIRMPAEPVLDALLGRGFARERGTLKRASTVAHMAYYLARYLGCDPVVLIGQDLGFTDGQYYASGAAIHEVWSSELNVFNTLEMLEWERIVRMGSRLLDATDVLGRPILTDEQMHHYLVLFEEDFLEDSERGLRVIDATEGGVRKQHTTARTLAEVLAEFPAGAGAPFEAPAAALEPPAVLRRVEERVRAVRRDVWRIGEGSRRAAGLLREMVAHHADQRRVNDLIGRVDAVRDEVLKLEPAFSLVQYLNQTGALKRMRADREVHLTEGLTPLERQRKQIERDLMNVEWLAEAADRKGELLDDAAAVLAGAPKKTREPESVAPEGSGDGGVRAGARARGPEPITALVMVDPLRSALDTPRDLSREFLFGMNPLRMMLVRLARAELVDRVVLLSADPERALGLAGGQVAGLRVEARRIDETPLAERRRALAAGRFWSETCWRGGLGNLSSYDEAFCPRVASAAMGELGLEAALFVGADWALVDPELCDEVVRRWRENPRANRLTFAQAPPGLSGCVVARGLAESLARALPAAWPVASVGGLLGYIPAAPVMDPIAQPVCVTPWGGPVVRDAMYRFIPDSETRRTFLRSALGPLGEQLLEAGAAGVAAIVSEKAVTGLAVAGETPSHTILELCTGRRTSGRRAHWERGSVGAVERPVITVALAKKILQEIGSARENAAVSFAGAGDPLRHPDFFEILGIARKAGIAAVHVRTDLLAERATLDALLDAGVDVISVDLMADSREGYKAVMGIDAFEEAKANVEYLLRRRAERGGPFAGPGGGWGGWIVPRMTRCDSVYADVRGFYDRWLTAAGAAVIDPLPLTVPRDRIAPLPRPESVIRRDQRRRMLILSDGTVPLGERDVHGLGTVVGNVAKNPVGKVWRTLVQMRRETSKAHGPDHPKIQMAC